MVLPEKGRAQELVAQQEAEAEADDQPPKRVKSYITYLDDDRVVEVPFTTAGDVMDAEEALGGGDKPYMRLSLMAKTEGWMVWKALHRHPDPAERPADKFEVWRKTIDQIWNERDKNKVPLAEAVERLEEVSSLAD